ncbi:VOC family protein [Aquipuribacter hungaricus]|uniref:VOC family protein n=1 Tax=Aquipuribacter hungaricus TaxID=545624 RepID=A0ABV7WJ34_9MICO
MTTYPRLAQVVLDSTDCRRLAEFYRGLLGLAYRPGDEPPPEGQPDPRGEDWLVLRGDGGLELAFQQEPELRPTTWPSHEVPMQAHLDTVVGTVEELAEVHGRALSLGARELMDRTDDPDEPLWVLADPDGHPFCVMVG